MNSLRKTVTRQRRDCDLNPGPSAPESSTLTTRLPGVHVNNMKKRTCLFLNSLSATFTLQVDKTLTRRRHISSCAMPSRSHRHYDDDTRQLSAAAAAAAFKIFVTSMASIEDRHRRRLGAAGSLAGGSWRFFTTDFHPAIQYLLLQRHLAASAARRSGGVFRPTFGRWISTIL